MSETKVSETDSDKVDRRSVDTVTRSDGSNDLKQTKSSESSQSESSAIVVKSIGIRRSELIMAQMDNVWIKGFFFVSIFMGMYINTLESAAVKVFTGYATSSYKQHSLYSTVSVIRSVVAAACLPFYARVSDYFGRLEMFCVALLFRAVGLVIMSQAVDVQKYAAGIVLYGFGLAGMRILWQINLSDASTLRWRLMAIGVLSMQTVVNTWSSGEVVTSLLNVYGWKFGIGMWAFTTPLVCVPYLAVSLYLVIRASRTEAWKTVTREEKEEFIAKYSYAKRYHDEINATSSVAGKAVGYFKYALVRLAVNLYEIFWKVDFIGCLLLVVIFGCILVPLTLAGGVHTKWQRASTIVPLVIGFLTIPLFVFWETKVTKRPMLPFKLMRDRGVWAGFLVGVFSRFIMSMPSNYSYAVLYVGMNASTTVATRTGNLDSFVEGISMPILGFVLSRVRRTKAFVLFGNAVMFIALGLFVHFKGTNNGEHAKYFRDGVAIAMCIMGFASIFFTRVVSVSVQTCTNHEYMATVTALFAAFYNIGSAIGTSVSGAIWTQDMYKTIRQKMIELDVDESLAKVAYASPYAFAVKYAWGSNARKAVAMAYAEIQNKLCITGLCLCVPLLVWALCLRDHRLSDVQNLDDEALLQQGEDTNKAGEKKESQVLFTNDKDYILIFLKKFFTFGRK